MRRLFMFSGALVYAGSMVCSRRASAETPNQNVSSLKRLFTERNAKDSLEAQSITLQNVLKWDAVKGYADLERACQDGKVSPIIMENIDYMSYFYVKPLTPERRIHARNILIGLYESSTTEEEKSLIMSIVTYFDLA